MSWYLTEEIKLWRIFNTPTIYKRINIAFVIAAAGLIIFISLPLILELMGDKATENVAQRKLKLHYLKPTS